MLPPASRSVAEAAKVERKQALNYGVTTDWPAEIAGLVAGQPSYVFSRPPRRQRRPVVCWQWSEAHLAVSGSAGRLASPSAGPACKAGRPVDGLVFST